MRISRNFEQVLRKFWTCSQQAENKFKSSGDAHLPFRGYRRGYFLDLIEGLDLLDLLDWLECLEWLDLLDLLDLLEWLEWLAGLGENI